MAKKKTASTPPVPELPKVTASEVIGLTEKEPPTPKKIKLPASSFIDGARILLQYYYLDGGNATPHAKFSGTIYEIDKTRGYCINDLHISFTDKNGDVHSGVENHVWVYGTYMKPLKDKNLEIGDVISFGGLVYAYKRNNGTIDFSLANLSDIKVQSKCVDTYKKRIKGSDKRPELCKCCIFVGKCNQQCIAPSAYKRELAKAMAMRKKLWPDVPIVV